MKAIITVGVSASGKSTYAEEMAKNPDWMEINRDNIRKEIWAKQHPGEPFVWFKWKWKNENLVTARQSEMVGYAVKNKKNIIISDTNLNENVRTNLFIVLTELGYGVELKLFEVSFEEALRRDTTRENGVGLSVIAKQFEQWHSQFGDAEVKEKLKHRTNRTDAILVDRLAALDLVKKTGGTLAVAGPAFARQESGVALRNNNPELLAAINQAITEMQKDGTLAKISEKYFGADVTK